MNKESLLITFNKMGKECFTKEDLYLFIGSLLLGAFGVDFNLQYVKAVAGFLFTAELMWLVFGILSLVITEIIIRHKKEKSNIEKLIDEEIKK